MQRLGSHESARTGGSSRQGTVLRFLGSCREREMAEFVKLLTMPFQQLTSKWAIQLVHQTTSFCFVWKYTCEKIFYFFFSGISDLCSVSPDHVIPLKKQQGFLNLLGQMFTAVGQNIKHYLDHIFPILLNLATMCASLLDQRNKVLHLHTLLCLHNKCLQ